MNSNEKHKGLFIMFTIGLFNLMMSSADGTLRWITLGIFITIGQIIDWVVYYPKHRKYLAKLHEQQLLEAKIKEEYIIINNIPIDADVVKCIDGGEFQDISNKGIYIWTDRRFLYLISNDYNNANNRKHCIPIQNIKYYTISGDIYNKVDVNSNISGGGSSFKGAIIGGALAGSTGAIIGSRKPVNVNVKTTNTRIDERETILVIDNKYRVDRIILRAFAYKILTKLIPEKDKEYILVSNKTLK